MQAFVLFVIAIFSPLLLASTLLVPTYAGIAAACYIIYDKKGAVHPLDGRLDQVFYMIDVYNQLFMRWVSHITQADFFSYTVPLLLLPLLATIFAIWLTYKLSAKLKDLAETGTQH
jgi:hypothetical protein